LLTTGMTEREREGEYGVKVGGWVKPERRRCVDRKSRGKSGEKISL